MEHRTLRRARRSLMRQRDSTDCGVACLASVLSFFDARTSLERLRELSGTTAGGTSLLGLYQAARACHLDAGLYEGDAHSLRTLTAPCILHVIKDDRLQHYVVCFGVENGHFVIGDPASDVSLFDEDHLTEIWKSKALLTLAPGHDLKKVRDTRRLKSKWIVRLTRPDANILFLATVLGLIISVLSLSIALFSQYLIDHIIPERNYLKLYVGGALLFGVLLSSSILRLLRRQFMVSQTRSFNTRTIDSFATSIFRLPHPFFATRRTGDIISRVNDTERIQNTITYVVGDLVIDILLSLSAFIFILIYTPIVSLIILCAYPVLALITKTYYPAILREHRHTMEARGANEGHFIEVIQGIGAIKEANRQDVFSRLTEAVYSNYQQQRFRLGTVGARFSFWVDVTGVGTHVAVLVCSAALVLGGQIQLGVLVAVLQMTAMTVGAAIRIALTFLQIQEARVAFDRMYEFASLEPEFTMGEFDRKSAVDAIATIEVRNLSFRYPGRTTFLADVSMEVRRGRMVALLGENGSGKSTLLSILERLLEPEGGEIYVNGEIDWRQVPTPAWRKFVALVPQDVTLLSGTVLFNLCMGDLRTAPKVLQRCRELGFDPFFQRLPQGYRTIVSKDGFRLSGGQRQVIALVRALSSEPELLLLDEPTAHMDHETEAFTRQLLSDLKAQRKLGIILASHRLASMRDADYIYVLEQGRVAAEGTPAQLTCGDNFYARLLADTRSILVPVGNNGPPAARSQKR